MRRNVGASQQLSAVQFYLILCPLSFATYNIYHCLQAYSTLWSW